MFERKEKHKNTIINYSLIIILTFGLFYILYIGQALIIPFIIALLFSFAILGLANFYKKFKIPGFLAFILSVITYFLFFLFIGKIISSNINEVIKLAPTYQMKIIQISEHLTSYFGIDTTNINLSGILSKINLQRIFNYVLLAITSISGSVGTILFYMVFILLESRYFDKKIDLMFSNKDKKQEVQEVLGKIDRDIKGYFFIKTIVSIMTAVISYLIMLAFGLDFAPLWALFIFILNFIPNIGSIIAVLFPASLSFLQVGFSPYMSLSMISLLVFVQLIVGNFVEPKLMGNKLNLSPLVIIIALSFWGYLWGIIGMLLSVPLVVIMNIILSKFEQTRPIAIFLSEKGDLQAIGSKEFISDRKKIIEEIKSKIKLKK